MHSQEEEEEAEATVVAKFGNQKEETRTNTLEKYTGRNIDQGTITASTDTKTTPSTSTSL